MTIDSNNAIGASSSITSEHGSSEIHLRRPDDPVRRRATIMILCGALVSLALAVIAGLWSVLYYIPSVGVFLTNHGINFTAARPLHTTFASAWIILGGVAVTHRYLQEQAPPAGQMEKWSLRVQLALWVGASIGVVGTLPIGITSGREYLGFHPTLSIPILLGWLLFAWSFFRATWRGFWSRPVYVTMWGVGIVFFFFTFVEQHAWLLPRVFAHPVVDLRLQWKSVGTLVGSFNLLVYGSLIYVTEKITGDERYARSRIAYALFGVGLLNSFTNFAHHTYHIPQSELIKSISFVVSMSEALIFTRVVWDLAGLVRQQRVSTFDAPRFFMNAVKWWTASMLLVSLLISIPPLNSLIHGTHVVTAHAMGSEIGIDTMILFAAISWILADGSTKTVLSRSLLHSTFMKLSAVGFNVAAAILVVWLLASGAMVGETRYQGLAPPGWLHHFNGVIFTGVGCAAGIFLMMLLSVFLRLAFRRLAESPRLHIPHENASGQDQ